MHPYREDAVDYLQWAAENGARVPPATDMDPASSPYDRFYAALQQLNLPLLTHGGHELAAEGGGHQAYSEPRRLLRALDHSVRVIVFPAGLRCNSLMYSECKALTAPCPAKKRPPSLVCF